jgi:uncharacterized protein (TIGR00297 family)
MNELQSLFDFPGVTAREWWLFAGMLVGLFTFVGIAESLRKVTSLTGNATRKIVHILVGVFVFFVPIVFASPVPGIVMSVLFMGINYISVRFRLFKGMDDTMRHTYGTVYFPLAFLLLIVFFWESYPVIISTSILILGIADAGASIIGEGVKNPRSYHLSSDRKSLQGSSAMFLSAFIVTVGCLLWYPFTLPESADIAGSSVLFVLALSFVVATVTTVVEAMAVRGLDNLFIPLSAGIILFIGLESATVFESQFFVGFFFAVIVSVLSFRAGFLAPSGAAATFLMAIIIFGIGGWKWTVPMLVFFIVSSLISRIKNKRKEAAEQLFEKTHRRDMGQVAGNGGIASFFVLFEFSWPDPIWYIAYLGAIAAATADTWGTEFGISFSTGARDILTFRKVPRGASGGISITGTFAGIVGGMVIALSGYPWYAQSSDIMLSSFVLLGLVTGAGIAGSIFDSYIGAALQALYKCPVCNAVTERKNHCDAPTAKVRGYAWITNDYVNLGCTAMGSFVAILFYVYLI